MRQKENRLTRGATRSLSTRAVALTSARAYVHGLAMLLIDGRLNALAASAQGIRNADERVAMVLDHVRLTRGKVK